MPTDRSRRLAAGAWTHVTNSHKVMDPALCDAFAEILDRETEEAITSRANRLIDEALALDRQEAAAAGDPRDLLTPAEAGAALGDQIVSRIREVCDVVCNADAWLRILDAILQCQGVNRQERVAENVAIVDQYYAEFDKRFPLKPLATPAPTREQVIGDMEKQAADAVVALRKKSPEETIAGLQDELVKAQAQKKELSVEAEKQRKIVGDQARKIGELRSEIEQRDFAHGMIREAFEADDVNTVPHLKPGDKGWTDAFRLAVNMRRQMDLNAERYLKLETELASCRKALAIPSPGIDQKYGKVWAERKEFHPGEPVFVIRAQDSLSLNTLVNYSAAASAAGLGRKFRDEMQIVVDLFQDWQAANKDKVKLPD